METEYNQTRVRLLMHDEYVVPTHDNDGELHPLTCHVSIFSLLRDGTRKGTNSETR